MPVYRVLFFLFLSSSLHLSVYMAASHAAGSESLYFDQLKIAENKVLRTRTSAEQPLAALTTLLSPSTLSPLGRPYQVGDNWEVAAIRTQVSQNFPMPLSTELETHPPHVIQMQVGLFHYEVIQTGGTPQAEYTVRIQQIKKPGFLPVDPRVLALELQALPGKTQTLKRYFFHGNANPVSVAPEGLHSAMTPLELYPLDIPETLGAELQAPEKFPEIPAPLARARPASPPQPDVLHSVWFEQDDFFGRPVQMLWQKGDPWPAYIKTSSGISILLRKGNS